MSTLFATVAVLWVGAQDVILGVMTVGELMGFNVLMGLVTAPVLQLVGLWSALQEVRIAVDRVADVLDVNPEQPLITDAENMPATLDQCEGRITFQNVNFSYVGGDETHNIMRDFNLEIEAGMNVAFVGPSGCGKSTIAKMILGFNIPKSGECRIDGKDITNIEFSSLRRSIGVVLQQSFAFAGSVAENIALGDPSPNMQAVKEASQMAGAHEFIINYPLGYQTLIGEKGMGLSGGQAQRICIARALYRKPKIMIFDEATSALDNESERRITDQIKKVVRGRTTISIAHRLSTIMHCDMICFIDDGQVQERGTHPQLIDPEFLRGNGYKGLYYRLAMTQFDLPPLDDDITGEKPPAETAETAGDAGDETDEKADDEDQKDDEKDIEKDDAKTEDTEA
jgi:ATP-binding cassette subfamily B protein